MNTLAHRVFLRGIGRPFFRALVVPMFALVLAIAMLDTNVDWAAARRQIEALDPAAGALLVTGLVLAWSLVAGRALRPVWQQPLIRFLVRQPLPRWRWVSFLLPPLAVAFAPITAVWWLEPARATPLVHYLGFTGLAWPIVLGASGAGAASVAMMALGTGVLASLVYGYLQYPSLAYVAVVVTLVELPLGVALIPRQVALSRTRLSGHLAARRRITALLRRDLRCLARTDWKQLPAAWLFGLVAAGLMLGFRVNGGIEGREAFETACIFLTIAATPAYGLLEVLRRRLGREIMRRRWPVTYAERGLSLALLSALVLGPCTALIVVIGSTMGLGRAIVFLLFAVALTTLTTGLFCAKLVTVRNDIGWFYVTLICHLLLTLVLSTPAYAVLAVVVIVSTALAIPHGLRAFSARVESIDAAA